MAGAAVLVDPWFIIQGTLIMDGGGVPQQPGPAGWIRRISERRADRAAARACRGLRRRLPAARVPEYVCQPAAAGGYLQPVCRQRLEPQDGELDDQELPAALTCAFGVVCRAALTSVRPTPRRLNPWPAPATAAEARAATA